MGPSGSGKSTLMHILAALDLPTSGYVTLAGTRLGNLSDTEITKLRRKHIGFIFQFFNLLPMLTAEENILLPLSIAGTKPDKDEFEELLGRVGLKDRRSHRPSELSGGQQQRVAVARALVAKPTVVFADEPTGNLDSKTSDEILQLLHEAVESYDQTMVMVTHDAKAATIADRVLFLADGLIVRDLGRADEEQIMETVKERHADVIRVALRGLAGRKLRAFLTAHRDRARRRDGERHVRAHGRDRQRVQEHLHASPYAGTDAVVSGKSPDINFQGDTSQTPSVPDSVLAQVRKLPDVEAAAGSVADQTSAKILDSQGQGDLDQRRAVVRVRRRLLRAPLQPAEA